MSGGFKPIFLWKLGAFCGNAAYVTVLQRIGTIAFLVCVNKLHERWCERVSQWLGFAFEVQHEPEIGAGHNQDSVCDDEDLRMEISFAEVIFVEAQGR
jgi:hypothetical protein